MPSRRDRCACSTTKLAEERNRFVAEQAAAVFIAHASPGGKIEALAREIIPAGKPVYTFDLPENRNLLQMGARPLATKEIDRVFGDSFVRAVSTQEF